MLLGERRLTGNPPGSWHNSYLERQALHFGQLLHNFTPNLGGCHLVLVIHRHPLSQPDLEHCVHLLPSHSELPKFSSKTQIGNLEKINKNKNKAQRRFRPSFYIPFVPEQTFYPCTPWPASSHPGWLPWLTSSLVLLWMKCRTPLFPSLLQTPLCPRADPFPLLESQFLKKKKEKKNQFLYLWNRLPHAHGPC